MTTIRTYQELVKLKTFKERYNYLKLGGKVGEETFGFDRYLNQKFYRSAEWKRIRDYVILRDNACDLGIADREINSRIIIHHMSLCFTEPGFVKIIFSNRFFNSSAMSVMSLSDAQAKSR